MTAAKSAARSTIGHKVTVTDFQHIGGCTATGAYTTAIPSPAVL